MAHVVFDLPDATERYLTSEPKGSNMIDEDRTLQLFGYTSDELSKGSHKKVVAVCEECGTYRTTEYRVALKSVSGNLCSACTTKNASAAPRPFAPDYTVRSVDESETFKRFGYYCNDLPISSREKVVAICVNCGKSREVQKYRYRDLCHTCKNSLRSFAPDYAVRSIDYAETLKQFGYDASGLSPASSKKVMGVCIRCGDSYETTKRAMNEAHAQGHCPVCATKFRVDNKCGLDFNLRSIDDAETFKRFGYHAYDLPATSGKYIVAVCTKCGRKRDMRKALYRDICRQCTAKMDYNRIRQSSVLQGIPYDEWEEFAKDQLYCPKFDERCRESNREKYDRRCFVCGKPESENVLSSGKHIKLSVHHVDMNKAQGCDGHEWRLVPLCRHHHGSSAHTPTWMARIQYLLTHVWSGA
jgi:Fe2+ or Zn2+ uptake regulation protein